MIFDFDGMFVDSLIWFCKELFDVVDKYGLFLLSDEKVESLCGLSLKVIMDEL